MSKVKGRGPIDLMPSCTFSRLMPYTCRVKNLEERFLFNVANVGTFHSMARLFHSLIAW